MNKPELVALFTALEELDNLGAHQSISRVIKTVLSEAREKPAPPAPEDNKPPE